MKKKEMLGYVVALHGAALTGLFVLLSGLRQFGSADNYFVGFMVLGLLLSLFGLYWVARAEES